MSLRSWLYFLARVLGDVNAIERGRILQRIANKMIGRLVGRAFIRGK